jgi:hypothetical protein
MRPRRPRPSPAAPLAAALLASLPLGAGCAAPDSASGSGGRQLEWAPAERLYEPYVADPRRPRFGISAVETDSDLPEAGGERVTLEIGGRADVLRLRPADDQQGGVQLSVEGGFIGDFDREASLDNLAWSGTYALQVAWRAAAHLALRIGIGHESSHLGDEYVEETGRPRVNYTRDELRLGASWTPRDPVRLYAEYGFALHRGDNSLQDRGRGQLGAEWSSQALRAGAPGWYAASDLSAFEEDDWEANLSLHGGWAIPRGPGRGLWRFALTAYDGRSAIGELSDDEETRVGLGVIYDL